MNRAFVLFVTTIFLFVGSAHAQDGDVISSLPWMCSLIKSADIVAGIGYTPGTYILPLSGGSGTGSRAKLTVGPQGSVVDVVFVSNGQNYKVGDVLTAAVPGGHGFSLKVSDIADVHPAMATKRGDPLALKEWMKDHPNDCQH